MCGFARAIAVSGGLCGGRDAVVRDSVGAFAVMPACARPGPGAIASAFSRCSVPVCVCVCVCVNVCVVLRFGHHEDRPPQAAHL